MGAILAITTQPRWRVDHAQRMRVHSWALVRDIRAQMVRKDDEDEPTEEEQRAGLLTAWDLWCWAQHHRDKEFIGLLAHRSRRGARLSQASRRTLGFRE